jgi:hypothetical protein
MSNPVEETSAKLNLSIDVSDVALSEVAPDTNTVGLASKKADVRTLLSVDSELKTALITDLAKILLENIAVPAYGLSVEQKGWIQEFIKASPKSFEKIAEDIKTITADGKIDVHDIPAIVKLFADIYHSASTQADLVNANNVISFIKFTLDVILDSKLLVLPEIEKKVIAALVDTSLSLLSMNIESLKTGKKKWYQILICC